MKTIIELIDQQQPDEAWWLAAWREADDANVYERIRYQHSILDTVRDRHNRYDNRAQGMRTAYWMLAGCAMEGEREQLYKLIEGEERMGDAWRAIYQALVGTWAQPR